MASDFARRFSFTVASTCLAIACSSAPPPRLGPGVAAHTRRTELQSIVRVPTPTIAHSPAAGGLIGSGIHAVANARLGALAEVTTDLDFATEYTGQLASAVKGVAWLRTDKVVVSAIDIPPAQDGGSTMKSILRVETLQEFSPDSTVLGVYSVVDFFPSAESATPSARVLTTYRSEPVGDMIDGDAIAKWADQRGLPYRAELAQAIPESVKLARLAIDSMARSRQGGGPPEEIWLCLTWGRPGFGRRLNAVKLIGDVIEETDARLVCRARERSTRFQERHRRAPRARQAAYPSTAVITLRRAATSSGCTVSEAGRRTSGLRWWRGAA